MKKGKREGPSSPTPAVEADTTWRKEYRELAPASFWGADMRPNREIPDFKEILIAAAKKTGENYFGYFMHFPTGDKYHLSKYPRRKYGPLPTDGELFEQYKDLLATTDQEFEWDVNQPVLQPYFRVVLGLEEGYGSGKFHSREEIASRLGSDFDLTGAEIFTVKHVEGETVTYQEPAVMIQAKLPQLKAVYALAEQLKQERFTVDDFNTRTSYIVETTFCTSPDVE